jgi:hypothetical protein
MMYINITPQRIYTCSLAVVQSTNYCQNPTYKNTHPRNYPLIPEYSRKYKERMYYYRAFSQIIDTS